MKGMKVSAIFAMALVLATATSIAASGVACATTLKFKDIADSSLLTTEQKAVAELNNAITAAETALTRTSQITKVSAEREYMENWVNVARSAYAKSELYPTSYLISLTDTLEEGTRALLLRAGIAPLSVSANLSNETTITTPTPTVVTSPAAGDADEAESDETTEDAEETTATATSTDSIAVAIVEVIALTAILVSVGMMTYYNSKERN